MAKELLLIGLLAIYYVSAADDAGWIDTNTLQEYRPKIAASLDWIRTLLKQVEGQSIPLWSKTNNGDASNKWTAVLSNLSILGPASINYKSVVVDPKAKTINVVAQVPKVTIKGGYNANGLLNGRPLYGKGNVQIVVAKIDVVAKVKLASIWNKFLVEDVDLSYTIGDIDVSAKGLKMEGIFSFLVNSRVSKIVLADARNDASRLAKVFGEVLKVVTNSFISGVRLAEALDRAKVVISRI